MLQINTTENGTLGELEHDRSITKNQLIAQKNQQHKKELQLVPVIYHWKSLMTSNAINLRNFGESLNILRSHYIEAPWRKLNH